MISEYIKNINGEYFGIDITEGLIVNTASRFFDLVDDENIYLVNEVENSSQFNHYGLY